MCFYCLCTGPRRWGVLTADWALCFNEGLLHSTSRQAIREQTARGAERWRPGGLGARGAGGGYLVHVDGVEAHLRRGELWEQRAAAEPRVAVGHAAERRHTSYSDVIDRSIFIWIQVHVVKVNSAACHPGGSDRCHPGEFRYMSSRWNQMHLKYIYIIKAVPYNI